MAKYAAAAWIASRCPTQAAVTSKAWVRLRPSLAATSMAVAGSKYWRAIEPLIGCFRLRQRQRHAHPTVRHIAVDGRAVRRLQPVFHVPDLAGNVAHGAITIISVRGSATMA